MFVYMHYRNMPSLLFLSISGQGEGLGTAKKLVTITVNCKGGIMLMWIMYHLLIQVLLGTAVIVSEHLP